MWIFLWMPCAAKRAPRLNSMPFKRACRVVCEVTSSIKAIPFNLFFLTLARKVTFQLCLDVIAQKKRNDLIQVNLKLPRECNYGSLFYTLREKSIKCHFARTITSALFANPSLQNFRQGTKSSIPTVVLLPMSAICRINHWSSLQACNRLTCLSNG